MKLPERLADRIKRGVEQTPKIDLHVDAGGIGPVATTRCGGLPVLSGVGRACRRGVLLSLLRVGLETLSQFPVGSV